MTELCLFVWDRNWAGSTTVVARDYASAQALLYTNTDAYLQYRGEALDCYPLEEGLVLHQLGDL